MKLFRVIGKDGHGFYFSEIAPDVKLSDSVSKAIGRDISDFSEQHPKPEVDGIKDFSEDYVFAFSSLQQMHAWFDKDMFNASVAFDAKVEVWSVDATHVKIGNRQVCFAQSEARLKEVFKLSKYRIRR